jgi:ABC-type phosphate transport system substrate-binding protein
MRVRQFVLVFTFVLASIAPCLAHHMAVVVNKDNAVDNVTSAHLIRILRTEVKKWPDGKDVVLILHKDSEGEAETLERLNKMSAGDLKAFLATHRDAIMFVDTDADVLKIVQAKPGAIGLVDVRSVDGSINVVKVDGKLPMESGYLPH